jgi:hypothetical protein
VLVLEIKVVVEVKHLKCQNFKIFEDSVNQDPVYFCPAGVAMVLEVLASVSHFAGKLEYITLLE